MKEKDNFILYHNQYDLIDELSNEEKGDLLNSLFKYSMKKEIPQYDKGSALSIAFKSIRNSIDINNEKYNEKCKKNQENINKRYEKENYSDKIIFLENIKTDYNFFYKQYPRGYQIEDKTMSFSEIFEKEKYLFDNGKVLDLKNLFKCESVNNYQITDYFSKINSINDENDFNF